MDITIAALLIVLFAGFQTQVSSFTFDEEAKRHYIYWDPAITKIIKDPSYSLQVEMGHFMDIVCPLTNLGITDDPSPPRVFNLYNVTKEGFDNCDATGGKVIFDCSLPDQENKLTIKFQSISPSPFGFRFQECQEYYFLAAKKSTSTDKKGKLTYQCTEKTERLRIRVGCSDDKKDEIEKEEPKAPVVPPTRKPNKTPSFIDRIRENHKEKEEKKSHEKPSPVVPEIVAVTPTSLNPGQNMAIAASRSTNDGNSASNLHISLFSTLFFVILSMLWCS